MCLTIRQFKVIVIVQTMWRAVSCFMKLLDKTSCLKFLWQKDFLFVSAEKPWFLRRRFIWADSDFGVSNRSNFCNFFFKKVVRTWWRGYRYAHCCGSMTFWSGSGSADPCLWLMDTYGSGSCYFRHWHWRHQQKTYKKSSSAYYFLKVHLHHFLKIKSRNEVTKH